MQLDYGAMANYESTSDKKITRSQEIMKAS